MAPFTQRKHSIDYIHIDVCNLMGLIAITVRDVSELAIKPKSTNLSFITKRHYSIKIIFNYFIHMH